MDHFIRISYSYDEIKEWITDLTCDKIIVYQHEADKDVSRTHVHMYIVGCSIKPDAMKTRFRKLYNPAVIGNSLWSWKKADDDGCITYMSNGLYDPVYNKGFDEVRINELRGKWINPETVNISLQNGKLVKEAKEPTQKTKSQLLEEMRANLSPTSSSREMLRGIRKVLRDNNIIIGQYKVLDYYDTLFMLDHKDDWLDAMERKINSRYEV